LCNIVFGVQRPDAGTLALLGEPYAPARPADALQAGVAMVHQHFSLVGNLSALDNFRLGRPRRRREELSARAHALGDRFGFSLDARRPVEQLSVGERQRIEIVKCLLDEPALLVLDEPTAVLPPPQIAGLLALCRQVARSGCAVLLVTHKLAEIGAVADRTSVLRRGRVVETVDMREADLGALVRSMVGREVRSLAAPEPDMPASAPAAAAPAAHVSPRAPLLEVDALRCVDQQGVERLHASLSVRRGEIVGIAGVEGNGQSELAAVLSGMLAPASGHVRLAGHDVTHCSPRELTRRGVGCVTEDRHATGCHLALSVAENLFLGSLGRFTRWGWLDRARMARAAEAVLHEHQVRGEAHAPMSSLSGGNQQKVVLARELGLPGLVFLLAAQPTRGLDVGAVEAVYAQIRRARERGAAVLLISSELEELLGVCDRVLVMYRGRVVGDVPGGLSQHERVGRLMSGQGAADSAGAELASC
ncbi:MAG TPA: ATP-binding cassette domain-containing protein, partial [Polyangiaceae bacterium]|nr:ATP-binding cassette domain-containing protein [Polyangiaceae bacterium]